MTTAHRPTWAAARGGREQGGARGFGRSDMTSVKDLHLQPMKTRQGGQDAAAVARRDLMAELLEGEADHARKVQKDAGGGAIAAGRALPSSEAAAQPAGPPRRRKLMPSRLDADDDDDDDEGGGDEDWGGVAGGAAAAAGAPEGGAGPSGEGEDSDSDSDDDSDDDDAALMAELERIKKERAEEATKRAEEDQLAEEAERGAQLGQGNPLLNAGAAATGGVKRRWDDDVVFRNQANEPKVQRRFINDTVRSDFHKRFLNRYIR